MTCPNCKQQTKIIDSRPRSPGSTYRKHRCKNGHVFTTLETFEKFLDDKICAAAGLRKYSLTSAVRMSEKTYKCDHCGDWHLTQEEKTDSTKKTI